MPRDLSPSSRLLVNREDDHRLCLTDEHDADSPIISVLDGDVFDTLVLTRSVDGLVLATQRAIAFGEGAAVGHDPFRLAFFSDDDYTLVVAADTRNVRWPGERAWRRLLADRLPGLLAACDPLSYSEEDAS